MIENLDELIKVEVELINFCYSISHNSGNMAVKNSLHEFYDYLCRYEGKSKIYAPMNMDYRTFVIGVLKGIDERYIESAIPVVLGIERTR